MLTRSAFTLDAFSDISNNVGPVKSFFLFLHNFFAHLFIHSEEWSSLFFVDLCIDDHGSLVIFRSASVRPKHLFDPYFDHDY